LNTNDDGADPDETAQDIANHTADLKNYKGNTVLENVSMQPPNVHATATRLLVLYFCNIPRQFV